MMARITLLEVGQFGCCCYIVAPDAEDWQNSPHNPLPRNMHTHPAPAVVIDPGDEASRIGAELRRMESRLEMILLTHAHLDHIGGVDELLASWPGAILACSAETSRRIGDPALNLSAVFGCPIRAKAAGRLLEDGEKFKAAGLDWRAVSVPGHDPGELAYILGAGDHVFSGDTIFAGSVGRSDFPGGDHGALVAGATRLLRALPPDSVVHPGHGPSTTVENELRHNPFLRG